MTWASNHDASLDVLRRVQGSLTVDLIMVPRADFLTCSVSDTGTQVKARNVDQFSYFPVVDVNDRILGLYHAERWFGDNAPDAAVGDDFLRLSEDIVIGADASIFDFVLQADTHPTKLVVSGNQIAGLVSVSDLQKLPVRASVFALITSLEMAMGLAIERAWPEPSGWLRFLTGGRRKKLEEAIMEAKREDGFVSEIAFSQISDKADIIRKGQLLSALTDGLEGRFKEIRKLRDNVAHGNTYAETPEAARDVCKVVKSVYDIKAELLRFLGAPNR